MGMIFAREEPYGGALERERSDYVRAHSDARWRVMRTNLSRLVLSGLAFVAAGCASNSGSGSSRTTDRAYNPQSGQHESTTPGTSPRNAGNSDTSAGRVNR